MIAVGSLVQILEDFSSDTQNCNTGRAFFRLTARRTTG
jgi:hypothetical protein